MKLFKVLSLLALAALTMSVQFTSSCNGTLTGSQDIDIERPYQLLTGNADNDDAEGPLSSLGVLTYNTFLRPAPVSWGDANKCRAAQIGQELAKRAGELDLVVLNESFAEEAVDRLVDTVGDRFPYRVLRRPRADVLRTSGGVSLLSRHPIRQAYTKRFDTCAFDDCLSTKGFLHAVVELSETLRVNVLATHLDAGDSTPDKTARKQQIETIRNYMDRRGVGQEWPTLLMGDLNFNGLESPEELDDADSEYRTALTRLSKTCRGCTGADCPALCGQQPADIVPAHYRDSSPSTSRSTAFNSMNCVGRSLSPCRSPNEQSNRKLRKRLDYILSFSAPTNTSGVELQPREARHMSFRNSSCDTEYLSDHKAVRADFDIARPRLVDESDSVDDDSARGVADASDEKSDE